MSTRKRLRAAHLQIAIDALAAQIPNGELLAATDSSADFLLAARDRIVDLVNETSALRSQLAAAEERAIERYQRALVEAGACPECDGDGWLVGFTPALEATQRACEECHGTGIRVVLSETTRAAVACAREAMARGGGG